MTSRSAAAGQIDMAQGLLEVAEPGRPVEHARSIDLLNQRAK